MNTRRLLVTDTVLISQPILIEKFGRVKAQFLNQIHYWQGKNQGIVKDDKIWIYNTAESWSSQLSISVRHFKRIIKDLKNDGILLIEKLSKNKSNRTNYYSIDQSALENILKPKNQVELPENIDNSNDKMSLSSGQNVTIYTENTFKERNIYLNQKKPKIQIDKLIEEWNESIGKELDHIISLSPKRIKLLNSAFKIKFGSNFEKWQIFCEKIKSNDWLMGRVNSDFKLSIDWVLKFDTIDKIQQGYFDKPFTKENNIKAEGYEDDKIISKDEVLESVKTFERNNLIKDIKFKIIERVGEKAYHSWFSHNSFELGKDSIFIKPHNVVCKEHLEINYNKVLKDLNLELMH